MKYSEYFKSKQTTPLSTMDRNFCKWIDTVENLVVKKIHFHLLDLNGEMYMEHFEDGTTPEQMAHIVLKSFDSWVDFIES